MCIRLVHWLAGLTLGELFYFFILLLFYEATVQSSIIKVGRERVWAIFYVTRRKKLGCMCFSEVSNFPPGEVQLEHLCTRARFSGQ